MMTIIKIRHYRPATDTHRFVHVTLVVTRRKITVPISLPSHCRFLTTWFFLIVFLAHLDAYRSVLTEEPATKPVIAETLGIRLDQVPQLLDKILPFFREIDDSSITDPTLWDLITCKPIN